MPSRAKAKAEPEAPATAVEAASEVADHPRSMSPVAPPALRWLADAAEAARGEAAAVSEAAAEVAEAAEVMMRWPLVAVARVAARRQPQAMAVREWLASQGASRSMRWLEVVCVVHLVPLRSERAFASAGEGFCLYARRGLLPG